MEDDFSYLSRRLIESANTFQRVASQRPELATEANKAAHAAFVLADITQVLRRMFIEYKQKEAD